MRISKSIHSYLPAVAVVLSILISSSANAAILSPSLNDMIINQDNDSLVTLLVFAENESSSTSKMVSAYKGLPRQNRHQAVVSDLRNNNRRLVYDLINKIENVHAGSIIREFWIAPVVQVRLPLSKVIDLTSIPSISAIYTDEKLEMIVPVDAVENMAAKTTGVATHLESLNIPAVWQLGITGQGRLVCSFDTGVEGTHSALQNNWRGNHQAISASFFAPSSSDSLPFDNAGHGTHTMGLMVGHNEIDTFGVAPDAEWIGAAVVDQGQSLSKTISDIIAAFEWAADPDGNLSTVDDVPDVVLNSWGIPTTVMDPCDATFYQVIDNLEAAGVVAIFAAGNEGPDGMSLRLPANRASSPLNSFAVGAINHNTNIIADFSSRGPSSCNPNEIKPEVVAPGVGIYSSYKNNGYTYKNGTSMAAPLIAGMIALMRQYNPEATVTELKTAIIESCRDLGAPGEDNSYGYGLPDALRAIELLPAPPVDNFVIDHQYIAGDGIAEPGETFDLFIILETEGIVADSVAAVLRCSDPNVSFIENRTLFYFENKSRLSIATNPFTLEFTNNLANGQVVPLYLIVDLPNNQGQDTILTQIMVGVPVEGTLMTHTTDKIKITVTDFGKMGLGSNSIFPAGGEGLRYGLSDNLMYEGGLIIGRNALQLSSSVRDSLGRGLFTDFSPIGQLTVESSYAGAGVTSRSRFSDSGSEIPIPIEIAQTVTNFNGPEDGEFILMEYTLFNNSMEYITNINFGIMYDFDLSVNNDLITYDSEYELLIQQGQEGYVGLRPMTDYKGVISVSNEGSKIGLSNIEKYALINNTGINVASSPDDYFTTLNFGSYNLEPYDSIVVAYALVVSDNMTDLILSAERAANRYFGSTDIFADDPLLPSQFALEQNYPNPFNPATTISFSLKSATNASLTVYNIMGQEVRNLHNEFSPAGKYSIIWDGTDEVGRPVASGMYFYRLKTDETELTKKMILIK